MIRDLTPAAQRSPFQTTAMNLAGLLLCVFTTLAVLINVSHDQSGAALSEVTAAFNGSLHDHGRQDLAVIAAGFREAAAQSASDMSEKNGLRNNESRQKLWREATLTVSNEEERAAWDQRTRQNRASVDVNGLVFSHLMTELERFCRISQSVEFGGQIALDLHSQTPPSDNSIQHAIERTLKTCRKPDGLHHDRPMEFEIVIWASTPASDALGNATQRAFDLEKSLQKFAAGDLSVPILLSSSGRIWTRPNSPRPVATLYIRTASE